MLPSRQQYFLTRLAVDLHLCDGTIWQYINDPPDSELSNLEDRTKWKPLKTKDCANE
jgi:hypothetical protein